MRNLESARILIPSLDLYQTNGDALLQAEVRTFFEEYRLNCELEDV
jgi:hypothetical protein